MCVITKNNVYLVQTHNIIVLQFSAVCCGVWKGEVTWSEFRAGAESFIPSIRDDRETKWSRGTNWTTQQRKG